MDYIVTNLHKIKTLTLIIWGENDKTLPVRFAYELNEKLSNSILKILKECGYFGIVEKKKEIYDEIINFIDKKALEWD